MSDDAPATEPGTGLALERDEVAFWERVYLCVLAIPQYSGLQAAEAAERAVRRRRLAMAGIPAPTDGPYR